MCTIAVKISLGHLFAIISFGNLCLGCENHPHMLLFQHCIIFICHELLLQVHSYVSNETNSWMQARPNFP